MLYQLEWADWSWYGTWRVNWLWAGASFWGFVVVWTEGRDVDDPACSQWIFRKSRLEHLESLSLCDDQREPVLAPSQPIIQTQPVSMNLEEFERSMSPGMKKFEKCLDEGFDLHCTAAGNQYGKGFFEWNPLFSNTLFTQASTCPFGSCGNLQTPLSS